MMIGSLSKLSVAFKPNVTKDPITKPTPLHSTDNEDTDLIALTYLRETTQLFCRNFKILT